MGGRGPWVEFMRAGPAFTIETMLQGFAAHARGVELTTIERTHVAARVKSKRTHDVDLRVDEGRLLVRCSCPAQSYGLEVCKHTWAALLEVDRRGGLEDLRGVPGTLKIAAAPPAPSPDAAPSPEAARPSSKPSKKKRAKRKGS